MSSDAKIIGYCRACGTALDETTAHSADGTIYCAEHVPTGQASPPPPPPPYTAPPYTSPPFHASQPPPLPHSSGSASPGLAFVFGLIPGVGAVYNGQYAKGLIHVVILGLIISIMSNGAASGLEPFFGILIPCFWFYMAFEAYHTAKQRLIGQPVGEFSSFMPARGPSRFPAGPVLLIAFGVLFLLNNLGWIEMRRALRYWPALLIVLGLYLLFLRVTTPAEVHHERE